MLTFIQAIARQEGFGKPGTPATVRSNPGNIEEGKFAQAHGALPSDGNRFAHWPTAEAGFAAMRSLLVNHYVGMTVSKAIMTWAPGVENNDDQYIKDVVYWTRLTPSTVLTFADCQ